MSFSGMQRNDGRGVYPFADDCDRFENGSRSTKAPPRGNEVGKSRSDPKTAISRIPDRRYVAIDEEQDCRRIEAVLDRSPTAWTRAGAAREDGLSGSRT
jgi:hypothetical protein